MKLLFSDSRKPDECVASYLIRTAENNGFRRVSHLLNHTDLHWKNSRLPIPTILSGKIKVDILLSQLGLNPIGQARIATFYKLFRAKIDTARVLSKHPKICPICIAESGYVKESWSLLPVTCCTKHKIILIDKNHKNGRMLSWYRPHLAFFDNQHKVEQQLKAPTKLVELSRVFERLLKDPTTCKTGPKILKELKANECLSILNFIAHFQTKMDGGALLGTSDNLAIASTYEKAYSTLKNWPQDFHIMLSTFIDNPMTNLTSNGIRKHFRALHDQLYLQRENKGIERIKIEFENYLQENWPTVLNPNRLQRISIDPEMKQYLSTNEAIEVLSCREPKLLNLVKSGIIEQHIFKGKKCFKRIEITNYLACISNNWSFDKTCSELEVSKHKLQRLLKSKIILAIHEPSTTNRDWLIDKKSINSLFRKLRNNATELELNANERQYSLEGFLKSGHTFEKTILLMLENAVKYRFIKNENQPYSFKQFLDFKKYV